MSNQSTQYLAQAQSIGNIDGIGKFYQDGPNGAAVASTGSQIDSIFTTIITFLTIVGGLTFLVYFIIGSLNWISAGGDAKKVDAAKAYMTNGAIGMITIVASYSIIWIVGSVLGLDILNPGATINALFYTKDSGP